MKFSSFKNRVDVLIYNIDVPEYRKIYLSVNSAIESAINNKDDKRFKEYIDYLVKNNFFIASLLYMKFKNQLGTDYFEVAINKQLNEKLNNLHEFFKVYEYIFNQRKIDFFKNEEDGKRKIDEYNAFLTSLAILQDEKDLTFILKELKNFMNKAQNMSNTMLKMHNGLLKKIINNLPNSKENESLKDIIYNAHLLVYWIDLNVFPSYTDGFVIKSERDISVIRFKNPPKLLYNYIKKADDLSNYNLLFSIYRLFDLSANDLSRAGITIDYLYEKCKNSNKNDIYFILMYIYFLMSNNKNETEIKKKLSILESWRENAIHNLNKDTHAFIDLFYGLKLATIDYKMFKNWLSSKDVIEDCGLSGKAKNYFKVNILKVAFNTIIKNTTDISSIETFIKVLGKNNFYVYTEKPTLYAIKFYEKAALDLINDYDRAIDELIKLDYSKEKIIDIYFHSTMYHKYPIDLLIKKLFISDMNFYLTACAADTNSYRADISKYFAKYKIPGIAVSYKSKNDKEEEKIFSEVTISSTDNRTHDYKSIKTAYYYLDIVFDWKVNQSQLLKNLIETKKYIYFSFDNVNLLTLHPECIPYYKDNYQKTIEKLKEFQRCSNIWESKANYIYELKKYCYWDHISDEEQIQLDIEILKALVNACNNGFFSKIINHFNKLQKGKFNRFQSDNDLSPVVLSLKKTCQLNKAQRDEIAKIWDDCTNGKAYSREQINLYFNSIAKIVVPIEQIFIGASEDSKFLLQKRYFIIHSEKSIIDFSNYAHDHAYKFIFPENDAYSNGDFITKIQSITNSSIILTNIISHSDWRKVKPRYALELALINASNQIEISPKYKSWISEFRMNIHENWASKKRNYINNTTLDYIQLCIELILRGLKIRNATRDRYGHDVINYINLVKSIFDYNDYLFYQACYQTIKISGINDNEVLEYHYLKEFGHIIMNTDNVELVIKAYFCTPARGLLDLNKLLFYLCKNHNKSEDQLVSILQKYDMFYDEEYYYHDKNILISKFSNFCCLNAKPKFNYLKGNNVPCKIVGYHFDEENMDNSYIEIDRI